MSPNSLMNTSLDSSSTSTSTSGTTQRQTKKAPSSVEDEGFNSCSGENSEKTSVLKLLPVHFKYPFLGEAAPYPNWKVKVW